MIQIKRSGLIADRDSLDALREEFDRKGFVVVRDLLEPPLLATICDSLAHGSWATFVHEGVGAEQILSRSLAVPVLRFLVNLPEFLQLASEMTGSGPFTWFDGRVYRIAPDAGHYDSWHDDLGNGLVAMSLNLSVKGYRGGVFQMRERRSEQLLVEFANAHLGDATFFRISSELVHRVTPVEPGEPKIAFAGWFESGPVSMFDRFVHVSAGDASGSQA